jgi:hypothetical protein
MLTFLAYCDVWGSLREATVLSSVVKKVPHSSNCFSSLSSRILTYPDVS